MSDRKLRNSLIRLAHENPQFRADLLPLLREGAEDTAKGDLAKDEAAVEEDEGKDEGKMSIKEVKSKQAKKWIQDAIKEPGRVRKYLGIPKGEDIPMSKLDAAIKKLKDKDDKSAEESSLLSALNLARRLKTEF